MNERYSKKSYVKAKKVLVDDYVKMGGRLFRVIRVLTHQDDVEIAFDLVGIRSHQNTVLIIPKNTILKIWNQA